MLDTYSYIYGQFGYSFKFTEIDISFWTWLESSNRLEKYLKWKSADLLARAMKMLDLPAPAFSLSEIPQFYHSSIKSIGLIKGDSSFWRSRIGLVKSKACEKYITFAFNIYQAKSASLPVPEYMIEQSVKKTLIELSREKELGPEPIMTSRGLVGPDTVLSYVDKVLDTVYGRKGNFEKPREVSPSPRVASRNAGYEASRDDGGVMGSIIRNGLKEEGIYDYFSPYSYLIGFFSGPKGAVELRSPWDPEMLREFYIDSHIKARQMRDVLCSPVGLVEPFKVRVITTGQPDIYHLARLYQPRLWEPLSRFRLTRLVGEDTSRGCMIDFASKLTRGSDRYLISGDYQAATDHFPSFLSEYCLEGCLERTGVPFEDRPVLLGALTRHYLNGEIRQRSGQLMGSPMSFPVLCLLNLAVTWLALDHSHDGQMISDIEEEPILINGDDLLFEGSYWTYLTWKSIARYAGLIPSVGKTLIHGKFCSINSELWKVSSWNDKVNRNSVFHTMERVQHHAVQLASGSIKGTRFASTATGIDYLSTFRDRVINAEKFISKIDKTLSNTEENQDQLQSQLDRARKILMRDVEVGRQVQVEMWQEFMDTAYNKEDAWEYLYRENSDLIKSLLSSRYEVPLCLPLAFGGLGFPLPPKSSRFRQQREPKGLQRLVASFLLNHPNQDQNMCTMSNLISSFGHGLDHPLDGGVTQYMNKCIKRVGGVNMFKLVEAIEDEQQFDLFSIDRRPFEPYVISPEIEFPDKFRSPSTIHRSMYKKLIADAKRWSKASGRGPDCLDVILAHKVNWKIITKHCQYS